MSLLVVFLGVSAGFLLQNRKEDSANRELEQKYMAGFKADIEVCIVDLKAAITGDSLWLAKNTWAIKQMFTGNIPKDSASQVMMNMAFLSEFNAQTNAYENITNSGNLNIISSYSKKQDLIKYYKYLEDFSLVENYFNDYHTERFLPYLIGNYDLMSQKFVVSGAENSVKFRNIFASFYSLTQQREAGYRKLLLESEEIKIQLEK